MQLTTFDWIWIGFGLATAAAVTFGFVRNVGKMYWKVLICLVPTVMSCIVVTKAVIKYDAGEGGFKLGADLVGGTKLVYEIDPERKPKDFKKEELAAALKKRIDPADLYNIEIRTLGETHVEIILPTGSAHATQKAEEAWRRVIDSVQNQFKEKLGDEELDVNRGQARDLMMLVQQKIEFRQWANLKQKLLEKYGAKIKEAKDLNLDAVGTGRAAELIEKLKTANIATETELKSFVEANYQPEKLENIESYVNQVYPPGQRRKDLTVEEVESIKQRIKAVGSMEFLILANQTDDTEVVNALQKYYDVKENPSLAEDLERRAQQGSLPPLPPLPEGEAAWKTTREELGNVNYRWVEVGKQERKTLGLDNASEATSPSQSHWHTVAADRAANRVTVLTSMNSVAIFSRRCQSRRLSEAERERKKIEYFLLCREPDVVNGERQSITGQDLISAAPTTDQRADPAVGFTFNSRGGDRFYNVTSKNRPTREFYRHLAILLDDQIISAPRLNEAIRSQGQISGNFTQKDVDQMVSILRSGALPATLKPKPTGENQISAKLGEDTTRKGILAVGLSFAAVLVFMCIYYRFSGLVASVALLANLLLTVAFMVFVNATFTLQAMAGLVLMLGMAVDANVLIYERLREERDRGANLLVALRNAYDRALPTILDTHLTSIFTSIVLYAFGDSRLKGFGVSLFAGLVISLFTSLFVTRTIFDLWNRFNLLKTLGMFRFFSKPNFDFMRIRHYWFAATITFSILGIAVFLWRGSDSLDIDFVGGTSFSGQLKAHTDIRQLRGLLSTEKQEKLLKVQDAQPRDPDGRLWAITYAGSSAPSNVELATRPLGATTEERRANLIERASRLATETPELDLSRSEGGATGSSRYFTISTREKEQDLVLVMINRLMVDENGQSLLKKIEIESIEYKPKQVIFHFSDYASPGLMTDLMLRELVSAGVTDPAVDVTGVDRSNQSRHKIMAVDLTTPGLAGLPEARIKSIAEQAQKDYNERPPYDQLSTIDAAMAEDALTKAFYAIVASWAAILIYLWFRFGTWKFGAAAVLCLIHDLTFTIGIIAFCHYVVNWIPWLATLLQINDFKINLPAIAALLTLAGYSVNDTIVVFDRIREVRGKNPMLTAQIINDSVNQTLSRTLLASVTVWLVVVVLYWFGGEGVHLFSFVMIVGVVIGTYSSIYIASPLLLIFGEGTPPKGGSVAPTPEVSPEGAAV